MVFDPRPTPDIVETRKFNVKMTSVCVLTIWVVCALTALRDAVARVLKDVPRGTSFGCARFLRRARSARTAAVGTGGYCAPKKARAQCWLFLACQENTSIVCWAQCWLYPIAPARRKMIRKDRFEP